jgi:UDPglucose 6-dehydrogenase
VQLVRIAVIGVGHVGLVSAACFAEWGHEVVGMDHDDERIDGLRAGRVPFYEPGLDELVERHLASGRLAFEHDLRSTIDGAEVAFACVGTPALPGGGPNLAFVEAGGREVATSATGDLVLVEKSTVPVSTGERLAQVIDREQRRTGAPHRIEVASNPEFLREGTAVQDTLHPDRIVIGASSPTAVEVLERVYAPVIEAEGTPVVTTDVPTAELIKHASNAFLATRISYINGVARICDLTGADVEVVAHGMGLDPRIGHQFLRPGLGYGGSCFPKDVDAFAHLARHVGYEFGLLEEVRRINDGQRAVVLDKLRDELWHLSDKTVTLLGAAFKPGTDDLREAPAVHLATALLEEGASVRVYDPVALPGVSRLLPEVVTVDDPIEAVRDAHAAVVCTEWEEIRALPAAKVVAAMAYPIVVDGRNALDPDAFRDAGARYHAIGRPNAG